MKHSKMAGGKAAIEQRRVLAPTRPCEFQREERSFNAKARKDIYPLYGGRKREKGSDEPPGGTGKFGKCGTQPEPVYCGPPFEEGTMKKNPLLTVLCAASVLSAALLGASLPAAHAKGKAKARLSARQAETAALKKYPAGKLAGKTNLEHEDGKWQYEVLVRDGAKLYEVDVDANTGAINGTEETTPAEEAKEKAAKAKGKKEPAEKDEKK